MKEKIEKMSNELVDNIGLLVVEISNAKIDIVEFIKEISKNIESFGKEILKLKKEKK